MPPSVDFLDLIRQARSGDEAASSELVLRFEPFIQRTVRLRMGRPGHRGGFGHEVSSADVCQSVFRSLFRGLRSDRYRLDQPGDLERLLRVMIRFNIASKARRSSVRFRELFDDFEREVRVESGPGPEHQVAEQDLIEAIQDQFTGEELEILTLRLDETPWAAIGTKLGCSGDSARCGCPGRSLESGRR